MDYKETSIKVLRFSGNKDHFLIWSEKFKAKAMIVGGLDILTGIEKMPSKADFEVALAKEDTPSITAGEKKTLKNYRAVIKMFSQLILSVDTAKASGKVAFEHIMQSNYGKSRWRSISRVAESQQVVRSQDCTQLHRA